MLWKAISLSQDHCYIMCMSNDLIIPESDNLIIPDDQQEEENDLLGPITFKDAVVLNADWTIETISSQINKGNIDLQPGFQRRSAWDTVRKSRLLESIIVSMPVPNIVLAENKKHRGRFIVIDGKQRLIAISEFLSGLYKLKGLDIRKDLNDLSFSELPTEDREYLENATLRSTLIRNWSDENFLYVAFYRLNSGSLPLSPQELRKALVGGQLLEAIEAYLISSHSFQRVFGAALDKRTRDSELVLRFLAYDRALPTYRGDFKKFLDETTRYFEEDWPARKSEAAAILQRLDKSLDTAYELFAKDVFKKWLGDRYERVINRAIFDCIVRFFCEDTVAKAVTQAQVIVVERFKSVCLEQDFRDSVEKTTKSMNATFSRVDRWGKDLADSLGLSYDPKAHRVT